MPKSLFLSVASGALALAASAHARDAGPPPLDEVVVTANRSPERLDRVGVQMTVLDAQDIRSAQTPVLVELLARTPGISFSRNGPVGSVTQVYVRGAEPGQTVVLIDGVKLNNPAAPDTAYNFANLLIPDVSRIEILRGPQSVLWGSQAIGGVINMITAEAKQPFEGEASAEGGSHAWGMGRASLGGKSERVSWRAAAAYLSTAGVSAFDKGTEADGFRHVGASGQAMVTLSDNVSLDLRGVVSRGRVDFDGFPPPLFEFADTREYGVTTDVVGYAGLNAALFDGRLKNRFALAYTRTDLKDHNPDQAPDDVTFSSRGRNRRFEYQGAFAVTDDWTAVFGAETERSTMRSAAPFSSVVTRQETVNSGYLQIRGEATPGLSLSGGVRYDDHSSFGGHAVGQAAIAWRPGRGSTLLRASWGQGFKAPSLYQLGSEFGNSGLRPETANGWDAGVDQTLFGGRVQVSAAWFQRRTKDQIDFFTCPFAGPATGLCLGADGLPRFGYYANIARTKTRGVELSGRADLTEALKLSANYTWLDARDDAPDSPNFNRRLARRPKHDANAELAYEAQPFSAAVTTEYVGARFDDAGNLVRLKSYVLWDVRASYALTARIEAFGRIENLFDKRYETIAGYGELGRTAYAGLRARF
jgi:vitamin B12 transporter